MEKQNFTQLFNTWYQPLCQFAYRYTKDTQASEDIVQNIFVELWQNRTRLGILRSPKNYLYIATRNGCISYLRKEKRGQDTIAHAELELEFPVDPDKGMDLVFRQTRLKKAIDRLPRKMREVFLLNKMEGLTFTEIAKYLDRSPKTIEKQVARALKLLKENLAD